MSAWTLLLSLSGCDRAIRGHTGAAYVADLSIQTEVPDAQASSARRAEDYLLPQYPPSPSDIKRCNDGKDVRNEFSPAWATVEVQRWGVMVSGNYSVSLNDGVLDGGSHNGSLIPILYDELVELRLNATHTGAGLRCWPEFQGRLLLVAEDATSWSVLQRIVYTAHQAGFEHVDLLVDDAAKVAEAESSPPYPPFSERVPAEVETRPRLSDEELTRAREQLARGERIRSTGDACVDRLDLSLSPSGTTFQATPRHGGALLEPAEGVWDGSFTPEPGRLETVVHATRDTSYGDVLEVLTQLDDHGDVALDTMRSEEPSYNALMTAWAGTWLSYSRNQFVPVVELTAEHLGSPLSCVDATGTIQR